MSRSWPERRREARAIVVHRGGRDCWKGAGVLTMLLVGMVVSTACRSVSVGIGSGPAPSAHNLPGTPIHGESGAPDRGAHAENGDAPSAQASTRPASPREAISLFLDFANHRKFREMGRIFGTEQGPLLGSVDSDAASEVEVRMEVIASVLSNTGHRPIREEEVAGSGGRAIRVVVDLIVQDSLVPEVPFVTVLAPGLGWLVREVDLARVMAGRGGSGGK